MVYRRLCFVSRETSLAKTGTGASRRRLQFVLLTKSRNRDLLEPRPSLECSIRILRGHNPSVIGEGKNFYRLFLRVRSRPIGQVKIREERIEFQERLQMIFRRDDITVG